MYSCNQMLRRRTGTGRLCEIFISFKCMLRHMYIFYNDSLFCTQCDSLHFVNFISFHSTPVLMHLLRDFSAFVSTSFLCCCYPFLHLSVSGLVFPLVNCVLKLETWETVLWDLLSFWKCRTRVLLKKSNMILDLVPPPTKVHNLIFGRTWVDTRGDMVMTNLTTGDKVVLYFQPCGWFGYAFSCIHDCITSLVHVSLSYCCSSSTDQCNSLWERIRIDLPGHCDDFCFLVVKLVPLFRAYKS